MVWLNPDLLARLDSHCHIKGVGRGKVLNQLLTEALPPVETAPAAPVAEPEAKVEPFDFSRWETPPGPDRKVCEAEAAAAGVTLTAVYDLKRELKLEFDQHLSEEALHQLREAGQARQRAARAAANSATQAQAAVKEALQAPGLLEALLASVQLVTEDEAADTQGEDVRRVYPAGELRSRTEQFAKEFLLRELTRLGFAQRKVLSPKLWEELKALTFQRSSDLLPTVAALPVWRRCLFYGTALRLHSLQGAVPASGAVFLHWCGFALTASHQATNRQRRTQSFGDRLFFDRLGEDLCRKLLGLPAEGTVTAQGVKAAYRVVARTAHPDAGGAPERFQKLTAARDELLARVTA